jgi:hypothetical protein
MDENQHEIQAALSGMGDERSVMVFAGSWVRSCGWALVWTLGGSVLTGCASRGGGERPMERPVLTHQPGGLHFSPKDKAQWEPVALPGKLRTAFKLERQGQRPALQAEAQSSASLLRQRLNIPPEKLGRLQFAWQVEQLMPEADMSERDRDDSPVRLILAFEGDRSRFSAKNAMLSDLTEALTGEPLPYATLMYVWSNQAPVDTVIVNPRTDRVRKWVVESGSAHVRQWQQYQRDIRADFEKAFGEAPGALVGMAIMTDSDNTRSHVRAWYGDIRLD